MWRAPKTVGELLAKNVADFGEREALVSVSYRNGDWIHHSWSDLDEISNRVATGLTKLGVQKGQKVACLLANNTESYYTYLAIHKIGAVFVPINIRLVSREVEFIVENVEADHLVSLFDALPLVEQIRDRLKVKNYICIHKTGQELPDWTVSYDQLMNSEAKMVSVGILPEDIADIIYTSGTTGLPKGVVLTQSNKVACGRLFGTALGFSRVRYGVHRLQLVFPFFTSTGAAR